MNDPISWIQVSLAGIILCEVWTMRRTYKHGDLLMRTFEHFDRRISTLETICGVTEEDNAEED